MTTATQTATRLTVNGKDLAIAIETVKGALGNPNVLPVLAGIKFVAKGDTLTLQATDLESAITTPIWANIQEPGEFILDGLVLGKLTKYLKGEQDVDIVLEDKTLTLSYTDTDNKLFTMPIEDYPTVEQPKGKWTGIDGPELCRLLKKVAPFALTSKETSRLSLTGVFFEFEKNCLNLVATNGYKMAIGNVFGDYKALLPSKKKDKDQKTLGVLLSVTHHIKTLLATYKKLGSPPMSICVGEDHVFFRLGETIVVFKIMDEEYPDYKRVIPKDTNILLVTQIKQLKDAVERCRITACEASETIIFELSHNDTFELTSNSSEKGETSVAVPHEGCQLGDKDIFRIAFRADYVLDALKAIGKDSETVKLWLSDSESAGIYEGEPGCIYIIMPIMLDM